MEHVSAAKEALKVYSDLHCLLADQPDSLSRDLRAPNKGASSCGRSASVGDSLNFPVLSFRLVLFLSDPCVAVTAEFCFGESDVLDVG